MDPFDNECGYLSWIYVWRMTPDKVGHVAAQLGGCSPKITKSDTAGGRYISLHPSKIPAFGPTIALPLPSEISTSLAEDMEIEAMYNAMDKLTDDSTSACQRTGETASLLPPDKIFKIANLDTQSMQNYVDNVEREFDEGNIFYQLCPQVNSVEFLADVPKYIGFDLDSSASNAKAVVNYYGKHKYNCATIASAVLASGGLILKHSPTPWGLTPNDVASQLETLSSASISNRVTIEEVRDVFFHT